MRKIMCIFLLTALLLSTLAACNAPDKTPDGTPDAAPDNVGNDTSADTTTAAPIETTTAEPDDTAAPIDTTVVADDTTSSDNSTNIKGFIDCSDDIDLSGIKIDIGNLLGPKFFQDPDPRYYTWSYKPHLDYSIYDLRFECLFSVYTDKNGEFNFNVPADCNVAITYMQFDLDTLPEGYGIRTDAYELPRCSGLTSIQHRNGYGLHDFGDGTIYSPIPSEVEFVLEPIASAEITYNMLCNGFNFFPDVMNSEGKYLYAEITLINGRFDDNFIDTMINGGELTYTVTLQSGTFSQEISYTRLIDNKYWGPVWEIRAEYLYYNNYITKEQYDNIVATTPPSDAGNGWM